MKTLIISDTHFGNHADFAQYDSRGINSRFHLQITSFDAALRWGAEQGCKRVIHLGDVFHQRGYVEPEIFNHVLQAFERMPFCYGEVLILTGNHDITVEGPIFNTAAMFNGHLAGKIKVFSIPTRIGNEIFMPFTKAKFEVPKCDFTKHTLYMHQSIFGAKYGKPILKGVDPRYLAAFKRVYCGHIHAPQWIRKDHTLIVGAPYHINFGDVGPHFVYVDDSGRLVARYSPPHPRFITCKEGDKISGQDFYRVISDHAIESDNPNVRVVVERKAKGKLRIEAKNDVELLRSYIETSGLEKPKWKQYYAVGHDILEEAKSNPS